MKENHKHKVSALVEISSESLSILLVPARAFRTSQSQAHDRAPMTEGIQAQLPSRALLLCRI